MNLKYVRIILIIIFLGLYLLFEFILKIDALWILIPAIILGFILDFYDKGFHKKHNHE